MELSKLRSVEYVAADFPRIRGRASTVVGVLATAANDITA